MSGGTELAALLRGLRPALLDDEWVFASLPPDAAGAHLGAALAMVREAEGVSLVLPLAYAQAHGLAAGAAFRCVTCRVHSSLEAVGLTAAMATALAARGIAANVIAGAMHDHLLVPSARADEAVLVLSSLGTAPSVDGAPPDAGGA